MWQKYVDYSFLFKFKHVHQPEWLAFKQLAIQISTEVVEGSWACILSNPWAIIGKKKIKKTRASNFCDYSLDAYMIIIRAKTKESGHHFQWMDVLNAYLVSTKQGLTPSKTIQVVFFDECCIAGPQRTSRCPYQNGNFYASNLKLFIRFLGSWW